jgi:hypothetical protein
LVLEVLPVGCVVVVVAAALPFAGVLAAGVVVVVVVVFVEVGVIELPDFAAEAAPVGAVLDVLFGCAGAVDEDGALGVKGAIVSPGFGKGLAVMLAINSLRPVSEPLFRYL